MNFWTAVVVIVAIVAFANLRVAKYRSLGGGGDASQARAIGREAELEREVLDLKKRLAVLERIATDDRQSDAIAKEIESLRDR
ncbi:hypothetical protein [Novosphingobium sp. Gsoil 351]|uniref:hypothetical protein n=1 Tax=Novosphingobium sp. Gsoil 351 TaxID=2675225 RepID=UPI0012B44B47|nr:hypothetical protein [Novosphingobium sp. Gsoil 351]QGN55410.1 hypothetical protein GKE62_13500 [Novosphingobium sp. Gsoil 351]